MIMDGNRRWAKARGLPSVEGHKVGFEILKDVTLWSRDAGVKELTVYAFSTENWKRSEEEVRYLMELLEYALTKGLEPLTKEDVRIRLIGERERFPESFQRKMREIEGRTKDSTGITLVIALSYGGRAEILDAVRKMDGEVTEESLKAHMWSAGLMDPDLIIRTGGEKRLSNFLTWHAVYSELFFTDTLWPDLSKEEYLRILSDFEKRERRMGK